MSSRKWPLILSMSFASLALSVFGINCETSDAQDHGNRRAPQGRDTRRAQGNLRERYIQLLKEMKNKGYDVSEAQALGERAKRAAREGNRPQARQLLEQAVAKLESLDTGAPHTPRLPAEEEVAKPIPVELSVDSSRVYVTEAVPSATSGKEIKDYESAFETVTVSAKDGAIRLELTSTPVFIEEKNELEDKPSDSCSVDSPFGIATAGFLSNRDYRASLKIMKEVGATYVKFMNHPEWGALVWDAVEPEKGRFDWSKTDRRYLAAKELGLDIIANLVPICRWDAPHIKKEDVRYVQKMPGHYPNDINEYLKFIRKAAERYDGDGKEDAPGSPIVKVWIFGDEMDMLGRWAGTPEEYARLFVQTYEAMKGVSPSTTMWLYGSNTYRWILQKRKKGTSEIDHFVKPMLKELAKSKDSLPDSHLVYPNHCYQHHNPDIPELSAPFAQKLTLIRTTVGEVMKATGFGDYTIVFDDTCSMVHTGDPLKERTAAKDMIEIYAVGLAHGIERIIWAQASDSLHFLEGEHRIDIDEARASSFTEMGLVTRHGYEKRDIYNTLLYYSYKLMTEKLQHTDWAKAEVVRESGGIYIYKFPKREAKGNVWVAWAGASLEPSVSKPKR